VWIKTFPWVKRRPYPLVFTGTEKAEGTRRERDKACGKGVGRKGEERRARAAPAEKQTNSSLCALALASPPLPPPKRNYDGDKILSGNHTHAKM